MAAITDNLNGFCYDIESDGFLFESTRIWTIWLKDLSDPCKKLKLNPFLDKNAKKKFVDWISSYPERPLVVGHNILGFDQFLTRCLMELEFKIGKQNGDEIEGIPVQFVDTYYWSMYLYPDRDGHSIEAFGERLGLEKIDFRQASIDAGIISASSPQGEEFKQHSELMDIYCLTPDHKVLNSSLKWVEIGSLDVGEKILGFDEECSKSGRKYKTSIIENNSRKIAPVYEVSLSSGQKFKTTAEHKWLVANNAGDGYRGYKWVETKNLRYTGKYSSKVPKICNMWEEDLSKESGWMAGMFDGEGNMRKKTFGISISQRPTMVLEKLEECLNSKGISFGKRITGKKSDCLTLNLHGTATEKMEFLGKHRPLRLLSQFSFEKLGRFENRGNVDEVIGVKYLGEMEIVELQTSTRTFICEGYPMHNCERDVDVNILVFQSLLDEHQSMYGWDGEMPSHFKAGQKAFFLMSCQEYAGFKFDVEGGNNLLVRIGEMMEEIRAEVEPKLPARGLKKTEQKDYTLPAKPFKKDGSYSSHMERFIEKHNGVVLDRNTIKFYGKEYTIAGGLQLDVSVPMEMANQQQMKDWFIEQGWNPTLWNLKRGPDGKPMRDPFSGELIKTSPKIQEAGKICPNLEEMEGDLVKLVVKWLSLRNRQSVLQGWLENPRLSYDGRIGAGRTGIAATHRQKHKVVN